MERHAFMLRVSRGVATLALVALVVAAASADVAPTPTRRPIAVSSEPIAPNELALRRALAEHLAGNPAGVVEILEPVDFAHESSFAGADRAAFLLGQAYQRLGSHARFDSLARHVRGWTRKTPYVDWLAFQSVLAATDRVPGRRTALVDSTGAAARDDDRAGGPDARALEAGLLLRAGDPDAALRRLGDARSPGDGSVLALYVRALALAAAGRDDEAELTALSTADTVSRLGRDLAGAALVRRASRRIARGEDAHALLEAVPPGSREAAKARHMLGLIAIEHGDAENGRRQLESLLASDSTYAERRDVALALAGQAMDSGRWQDADARYRAVDDDWSRNRDELQRLLASFDFGGLWAAWQADDRVPGVLVLDAGPSAERAARLAASVADGTAPGTADVPLLDAPQPVPALRWSVPPPPPDAWQALSASSRTLDDAAYEYERTLRALAQERDGLSDRRRYLMSGFQRLRHEELLLVDRTVLLDSLRRSLDALDARLRAVRDAASRHVAERAARLLEESELGATWMRAMRHFHLEGPEAARLRPAPAGLPGPDTLLAADEALTRAIQDAARRIAEDTPGRIARSYTEAWRPRLIDRAGVQAADAGRSLAWTRVLEARVDSAVATCRSSDALRRLERRATAMAFTVDSLREVDGDLRAQTAKHAVEQALAALDGEREAIDYGLAAAAYGRSVELGAPDSTHAPAVAVRADAASTSDTSRASTPGETDENPEAALAREQAIAQARAFLERHPRSVARGEIRFRLADLLLTDERQRFRVAMAGYVRGEAGGTAGKLPVLDYAPALGLYRTILAEDRDFPHRDAVLFNAGMILADDGSPEAMQFFADLVAHHPRSPYGQEAYLRMGDMHFLDQEFPACIALYDSAAAGPDPSLTAIALYKLGWAEFNEERFVDAVDAFRSVLDLYASAPKGALQVDVEKEAEADLVQTLARAGGADEFARYFDRIGKRPYEARVLASLGQHFRRYNLFAEAAQAERLLLAREPLREDAVATAQRLIETEERSSDVDVARASRLEYAERFAPGGEWARAQSSDSVRAAGAEFARASWKSVALHHHSEARRTGASQAWREARRLYETLLARFPDDPDAPTIHLEAGEACARLGEYAAALEHDAVAARTGRDSLASQAMWQRVAVSDAWYETTRTRGASRTGSDSLAHLVIQSIDDLQARFPEHPEAANVDWRAGNLAFAHGWFERSATDFGRMASRHPADKRAPLAACLRADALFRLGRFDAAGAAYEEALASARAAGVDSLVRRTSKAIPVAYYRNAEASVAADSNAFERHARLFEKVATGWPTYEYAYLAQYRAGLAYLRAGSRQEGVRAMETLIRDFPRSEYVRDAHLQIARAWESGGERGKAAQAYAAFAEHYPKDDNAATAWLKAADLFADAGLEPRADELRLAYIQRYPNDIESAMEILEQLARRELKTVGPEHPISALTGPPRGPKDKTPPRSHLADYLQRAQKHPELASKPLIAEVRFLEGEEALVAYRAARLRLPLDRSIPAKQKLLDGVLARYKRSVDMGFAEWAHASTYRIGEALVAFGEALEQSERPADLKGDDLRGYDDVLHEQSQTFYDRGESVWSDLLKQKGAEAPADRWVAQAQSSLWARLGNRFYYRPEVEYPLVAAVAAERLHPEKEPEPAKPQKHGRGRKSDSTRAPRKGDNR